MAFSWTAVAGTTNLSVVFEPENSSASLVKASAAQDVNVAAAVTKATVATVQGNGSTWLLQPLRAATVDADRSPFFGRIKDGALVAPTAPKVKVTMAKSGTGATALTPSGTVRVLLSTSKTGGNALTLLPATLAADGSVTVTLPAATKWPVTGTAINPPSPAVAGTGGVVRWLNIVYSGNTNFYGSTTSVKILVTSN
jgi:hypothetical protein